MSDYWEYSDSDCPKCGSQMASRRCGAIGCDDGVYEDDDGINGRSLERCDECKGTGWEEWCRECGWDNVFKCFLSPKYEAEWKAKQGADSVS